MDRHKFDLRNSHNQQVVSAIPAIDRLDLARKLGAPVYEAQTLADLGGQLAGEGVPSDAFVHELGKYNEACGASAGSTLCPPRIRHAISIVRPPLYAMRCVPGITCTTGGVAIDEQGRALDAKKTPIGGLFVAGADVGGIFGRHYAGFLGWALVSGRLCGENAVEELLRHRIAS